MAEFSFVLSQFARLTDGQMDGHLLIAISRLHTCNAVKRNGKQIESSEKVHEIRLVGRCIICYITLILIASCSLICHESCDHNCIETRKLTAATRPVGVSSGNWDTFLKVRELRYSSRDLHV